MAKAELLVIIAFTALACSTEVDDTDQKKRGAGKENTLNSIPTGGQKQDYTYSIYAQNPSSQSGSSSQSYQSQVPSSFYPNQASQYYSSSNAPTDSSSAYAPQPQINLLHQGSSQFVPINFVPNPGYQSKYQLVTQPKGNIQLAILQQPNAYSTPSLYSSGFPQNLFTPTPTQAISPQQNFLGALSTPGQFASNIPVSLGNSYLGQPSTMVLLAQPNPSLYNNILYNNPAQNLYSNPGQHLYNNPGQNLYSNPQSLYTYFQSSPQPKYGLTYSQGSSDLQVPISQSVAKEENEISPHTSEYTVPSEASSNYKNAYTSSRSSYTKL